MKKHILIAFTLLISVFASAQITVQESNDEKIWSSFTRTQNVMQFVRGNDTLYVFYFKNYKYQAITDIQYIKLGNRQDCLALLDLIQDVIDNKKEYDISLYNNTFVSLKKEGMSCWIWAEVGYTYFDKNQISKLREALISN